MQSLMRAQSLVTSSCYNHFFKFPWWSLMRASTVCTFIFLIRVHDIARDKFLPRQYQSRSKGVGGSYKKIMSSKKIWRRYGHFLELNYRTWKTKTILKHKKETLTEIRISLKHFWNWSFQTSNSLIIGMSNHLNVQMRESINIHRGILPSNRLMG